MKTEQENWNTNCGIIYQLIYARLLKYVLVGMKTLIVQPLLLVLILMTALVDRAASKRKGKGVLGARG